MKPPFLLLTTARLEKARPAVALRLQVIRTIDVALLWPLLAYTGHGFSLKGAIMTVWSGLRGVVGVALALLVFLDPSISDEGYKVRVLFFMGTTVCLTVLVQGSLITPLLKVRLDFELGLRVVLQCNGNREKMAREFFWGHMLLLQKSCITLDVAGS